MDALLLLIVSELKVFEGLSIQQPTYTWDGVEHPQGPKLISWQNMSLFVDEKTDFIKNFLPEEFLNDEFVWLAVSNDTLENYRRSLSADTDLGGTQSLEIFIESLLTDTKRWILAFVLHYDQIDRVREADIATAVAQLRDNLTSGERREGFVTYGRARR